MLHVILQIKFYFTLVN